MHFSVGPNLAHLVTPDPDVARDLLKNVNADRCRQQQGLSYVLSGSMGLLVGYRLRSTNHLLLPLAYGKDYWRNEEDIYCSPTRARGICRTLRGACGRIILGNSLHPSS
jgi:hypothetical protein